MQPHKPTEPIADLRQPPLGAAGMVGMVGIYLLMSGCSRPLPAEDDADSQDLPDLPTDLPNEPTEFTGVLHGFSYQFDPTRFWECESSEVFEIGYPASDSIVKGSCYGVYTRIRGTLDRSFDPPRLTREEILEARWCVPGDCAAPCNPMYNSCYVELEKTSCAPVPSAGFVCTGDAQCKPLRFSATQSAGWMHHECQDSIGQGLEGDPCEYPADPGDLDTCEYGFRCWNPEGDITAPGTCVPYCELMSEFGPPCEGTCVQCSSSEEWGLCMTDCSGDDCNVDEFC